MGKSEHVHVYFYHGVGVREVSILQQSQLHSQASLWQSHVETYEALKRFVEVNVIQYVCLTLKDGVI